MPWLRRFLRGCIGFAALAYLMSSFTLTPKLFRHPLLSHLSGFEQNGLALKALGFVLLTLGKLIYTIPLILTIVFGVAWWGLKTGKPYARPWAIAASVALMLTGMNFALVSYWMSTSRFRSMLATFLILAVGFLFVGIAGLFAFWKRDTQSQIAVEVHPARIRGDGTHQILDALALVLQIGGTMALMSLYTRWGHENDLPIAHGLGSWFQFVVVIVLVTLIHESGHALVGVAVGMKLRAFVVGPFQWRVLEGRWTFRFRPAEIFALSGAAGLTAPNPDQSRWNEVAMIAAGPFANLVTGSVAAALAYSAEFHPWERFWEYFALFATVSLVAFAVNLIPFRPEALYSDGARIYQLFRGGPLADYYRAVKTVQSTLVSPRRPCDYDIAAIQRASGYFIEGEQALLLRLFATEYHFDRGDYPASSAALADADRIYHESATNIAAELHTSFIIKGAIVRHDVAFVCQWWERMNALKKDRRNQDYWLAKCGFHWAEGNADAAREAWATGQAYLQKLPNAGTYNFDRDCYLRMKELLESAPDVNAAPAVEQLLQEAES
jgi:Peptidase family M50